MCAIFGYIAKGKRTPKLPLRTLEKIVAGNVMRGPHAFGLAWVTDAGRIMSYRQAGNLADGLGVLAMARDARMLIGHLRWATHGDPRNNINNHPHPVDGGWLVHNGIVGNYEQILEQHELWPSSNCDSEAIGLLVERAAGESFKARMASAVGKCRGSLAVMALWARPARMLVVRNGNPLHWGESKHGHFFATLPGGLPGEPRPLIDANVAEYVLDDQGNMTGSHREIRSSGPHVAKPAFPRGLLFDAAEYAGG